MSDRHQAQACASAATAGFREVGTLDQLPPGAALRIAIGETELALVNVGGHVVAIGDLCLRCGDTLSTSALSGTHLTCGKCGWQYDVERGHVVGLPALAIETHEVRVDDGHLFISVAGLDSRASMP